MECYNVIMSESSTEKLKNTDCFPVTKEAVNRSLNSIAQNPHKAITEEFDIADQENPEILPIIDVLNKALLINESDSIEGGMWVHKILRTQAIMRGRKLPIVSPEQFMSHVQDVTEELGDDEIVDKIIAEEFKKLSTQEPELGKGLEEIGRYRGNRESFYYGATHVYKLFRKASQVKQLKRQFKL